MINKRKVNKIAQFLVGLVAVLCLLLFLPVPLAVAQIVSVSVDAPATVAPGGYFTAQVDISPVTDFDAALFEVVFDSSVLEIEDITPGADITDGLIDTTNIPVDATNEISAGRVRILVNVEGTPGVTGEGYLCQIQFHAIGAAGAYSTINLQNGTLGDKNGDAIVATWTGTTVSIGTPDITPPTVINKSPVGSDVAVDSDISVTFSKAMDKSSAEAAFSISPSIAGSFSWSGNTMTFNPSANLAYGTEYTVTIAGTAEDLAGSGLDGDEDGTAEGSPADDYSWSFTTEEVIHAVAAEFSASPTVGVAPLEVQFIDQSTGDIDSWLWDFGDGSSSTSENPTHTYVGTGEYTVTLTVSGPSGSDTEEKVDYITVISSEEAETLAIFSASDLLISPQQVQPDQQVEISIDIANDGGATGSYTVLLYINSNREDSRTVSIPPGSTQNVVFTVSRSTPGSYEVSLEGLQGQFTVVAPSGTSSPGGLDTGTLIVIVAIIVALIVAIVFVFAKIRRA